MFWLTFDTSGDLQVQIVQANHLMLGRIKVGMAGQKGEFQEGHQLDAKTVKKIPAKMIGRTLTYKEAMSRPYLRLFALVSIFAGSVLDAAFQANMSSASWLGYSECIKHAEVRP